ncbi:MAG: ATP-binding cassette domain-containing protein [Candidatus Humimicrobiaceae bacterium]
MERWDKKRINKRAKELLNLVDLPEMFAERHASELSGGQQQRVGLARAIVMDPPLLLMDDPFGALDPILRKQLQIEFLNIRKELGKTIVFVTHDIEEAFKLGDRIAIMDKAKLVQVARPNELILNPKNDFVSQLVSSHKKFLHMDNLIVKDLMVPLTDKYIYESSLETNKAAKKMKDAGVELAVVISNSNLRGIASFNAICTSEEKTLKDITQPVRTFSPEKCLSEAVAELKGGNSTLAVVAKNNKPVGLLLTDKLLLDLV